MNTKTNARRHAHPVWTTRIVGAGAPTAAPVRDLVRDEVVLSAHTWVVKVGSSVLAGDDGRLDLDKVDHLAEQLCKVVETGRKVALVSSGAVAAGIGRLGLKSRPDNLRQLQAAAAIGQSYLMRAYDEGMRRHGHHAAQLLLTHEDFDSRPRYLNMRNTLNALFEWDAVPIINENDTISVDEIKFGDNDRLAAMVANLIQAPLLVILSVVDGLHLTDPALPGPAEVVSCVPVIDDRVMNLVCKGRRSKMGTGGMGSKLTSARLVTQAGGSVIIASGSRPEPLTRILAGEEVGTLFLAHGNSHSARKRWIGLTARPRGRLIVDAGAREALEKGRSLLAIGVVEIVGDFGKGDVVAIRDAEGREFARGLCNYSAEDARSIRGKHTFQVRKMLGDSLYDEVVHRDNLVLIL